MNLLSKIKPWGWGLLASLGLWFLIWGGYDANFWRVIAPDFPYSFLDAFQALRAFLPLLAVVLVILFLAIKKHAMPKGFFLKPLGLLLLYSLMGILSSGFSQDQTWALYWAVMYGAVIMVLLALSYGTDPLKKIAVVISFNWIIAGFLSVALAAFFLIQPGVLHSLTLNFLFCMGRPYEGFGGIPAAVQTLGIAGTRPTGLGRYAAIIALVTFCRFLYASQKKQKMWWLAAFIISLAILLFSKGKTEIAVFIFSMIAVLVIGKKFKVYLLIFLAVIILISGVIVFYNIPCSNSTDLVNFFVTKKPVPATVYSAPPTQPANTNSASNSSLSTAQPSLQAPPTAVPVAPSAPPAVVSQTKTLKTLVTLSGRTNGVWSDAWHLFLTAPLFGYGFQADRIFLTGQNVQNTLLGTLIQTGIAGTVPFMLAFLLTFYMLYHLLRNPRLPEKQKIFLIEITAVVIFLVVRGLTESLAFYSADWIFMAPLIAYIQILYFNTAKQV